MRISANEKGIERRQKIGKTSTLLGFLFLIAAVVFSFMRLSSALLMQAGFLAAMVLGVALSFIGGYYGERFVGPQAHHVKVREALKRLDHQYVLFQYALPVPHVLLGPEGLTVIVVKSQPGTVTYADGKWQHRQRLKFMRQLAGQESLGVPDEEVQLQVQKLKRFLAGRLPEVDVPVRGVVLFVHPEIQLSLDNPPLPVFPSGRELRAWLRGPGVGKPLPAGVKRQVEEALLGGSTTTEDGE